MNINLQPVINSRLGTGFCLVMSRLLSPGLGYRFASFIADLISRQRQWPAVQAIRSNQWMVSQGRLPVEQLDRLVIETFRHRARCLYDLYRNLLNRDAASDHVRMSPAIQKLIEAHSAEDRPGEGVLVVGVHLSNFDFLMQTTAMSGLRVQVLSFPRPGKAYQLDNRFRVHSGLTITPTSKDAIRKAQERLRAGGVVLSGLDRPVPGGRYQPQFFGKPAALPVLHVPLALKAGVPVVVATCLMGDDGSYEIILSDPIEMQPCKDRQEEILSNAERVLAVAEPYIARNPQQWAMFYPVWPDAVVP